MSIPLLIGIDELEEMAHGRKHAFADMVSWKLVCLQEDHVNALTCKSRGSI